MGGTLVGEGEVERVAEDEEDVEMGAMVGRGKVGRRLGEVERVEEEVG